MKKNLFISSYLYKVIFKRLKNLLAKVKEEEIELFYKLLGERIRQLRIESGYSSQETFAYDAEIPRAQYGKYEKGTNMTILSLCKILKFHKMSFETFFSEDFQKIDKLMRK